MADFDQSVLRNYCLESLQHMWILYQGANRHGWRMVLRLVEMVLFKLNFCYLYVDLGGGLL